MGIDSTHPKSIATDPKDDTGTTRDLGPFRQGINVNSMRNFYSGLTPRLSAGNRPNVTVNGRPVGYRTDLFPEMVKVMWFDESLAPPHTKKLLPVTTTVSDNFQGGDLDLGRWSVNAGTEIRSLSTDATVVGVVLDGAAAPRYLQPTRKFRGEVKVSFKVANGPWENNVATGMNMESPDNLEDLIFQYSTDGASWTTLHTVSATDGTIESGDTNGFSNRYTTGGNYGQIEVPTTISDEFYIRWAQLHASAALYDNWAITDVSINQRYPLVANAVLSTSPVADAGGKLDLVPNFEMEQANFGQPKTFRDEDPWVECQPADGRLAYDPTVHFQPRADWLAWPLYLIDKTTVHQYDGVIELYPIRSSASRNLIEFPEPAQGIKGRIDGAYALDSRGRGNLIHQQVAIDVFDSFEAYEDGVEWFGPYALPGYLTDQESYITPWVESSDWEERADELGSTKILGRRDDEMASIFLLHRESTNDLRSRGHKSATAGFYYDNAIEGTDSIAFGGLKR
jgi:hypothetical protein